MASRDKSIKRGVELYIDGKEIKKDIASVERECRKLTKELRSMEMGSADYIATSKRIRELNGVLAEHREGLRAVREDNRSMLEKLNAWVGKCGTLMATATAGIAAMTMAIMKYRKELLEREDTKADVKALTGLDDESIAWLEQKAKELSTTMTEAGVRIRQSATEILDAYKLVGSAKPELLTDKEALASVTEQALVLAQAAGMSLKDAVDAVTLSMNQYGAASDEAARYANVMAAGSKYGAAAVESVTIAVKKSGVAASTANVPIEQLVGSIEALAEKGIKDDVAGTGLKTFFLKLEKQASDVRPSVVGLQTALENLAAKNLSTSEMIKMFGLEAYTVAQALVSSADKVKYYSDAVTATATATEQASIKSQTAAARLEQLKNEFTENGMVLAQQLAPIMSKFMGWTNKFVQALPKLINWVKEYGTEFVTAGLAIVALTTYTKVLATTTALWNGLKSAVVAYRTAMVLTRDAMIGCSEANKRLIALMASQNIITKAVTATAVLFRGAVAALTLRFNEASRAMGTFNAIAKVNPYALLIAGITALGYAFAKMHQNIDQSVRKMREYKRIQDEASDSLAQEKKDIEDLNKVIHDESASYDVRKRAIEDMQSIVQEYHASLSTEGKLIDDNTESIKAYVKMLSLQAEAEAAAAKLTEAKAAKHAWMDDATNADRALKVRQAQAAYNKQHGAFYVPEAGERTYGSPEEAAMDLFGLSPAVYRVVAETLDGLEGEVNTYQSIIDDVKKKMKEVQAVKAVASTVLNTGPTNGATETADAKRVKKALLAVEAEFDQKAAELKKQYIQGEIATEEEYTSRLAQIEMERIKKKLQVAGLEESQRADLLDKLMTLEVNIRKKIDALIVTNKAQSYEEELQLLKEKFDKQKDYIKYAYELGIIPTEERYHEYLLAIEKNYQNAVAEVEEKAANERKKKQDEEDKQREKEEKEKREAYLKDVEKYRELAEEISDIFADLGEDIGSALLGEKDAWKKVLKDFLIDAIKMVEKYLLIKQAQIMADAIASSSTVVGAAPAIAKAAMKMAAIKGAFGIAKGAVNSFDVGGFTGAGRWNEPKGVVHSNEFVANRFATQNPNVLPVLGLIDAAQRSGSIRHLTGEEIASVALSNRSNSNPVASSQQSVPVTALIAMMARVEDVMKTATEAYKKPSKAVCYVKGKGGIEEAMDLASLMDRNASR